MSNERIDEALTIDGLPDDLRRPILLLAFFGWNDAAEAATDAIKFLRNLGQSPPVASLDPDEFFVFTEHRPTVKWVDGDNARREVVWPLTEFTVLRRPEAEHDLVLGLGTEPDLRWRRYCRAVLQVAEMANVEEVVTLGRCWPMWRIPDRPGYRADLPIRNGSGSLDSRRRSTKGRPGSSARSATPAGSRNSRTWDSGRRFRTT